MNDQANNEPNEIAGVSIEVPWERTLQQMFKLFVEPEVRRRQQSGSLTDPFTVQQAQILFFEGKSPVVRLNDEVRISFIARAPRAIAQGETFCLSEIERIEGSELHLADADAGHFTAVLMNAQWHISFDFRTNKFKALSLVERAEQYCCTAAHSLGQQHHGPAIENLFAACELAAKARLIVSAMVKSSVKTHGTIHAGINLWAVLGNVDREFVETFNKLLAERDPARYNPGKSLSELIDKEDVAKVEAEIAALKADLKRYSNDP